MYPQKFLLSMLLASTLLTSITAPVQAMKHYGTGLENPEFKRNSNLFISISPYHDVIEVSPQRLIDIAVENGLSTREEAEDAANQPNFRG